MGEKFENEPQLEISQEELESFINGRLDEIWQKFGWRCKKEIIFSDEPIRPGGYARATWFPKSTDDPEDKFTMTFFTGKDDVERMKIKEMLDFIINHETAHLITEKNKLVYSEPLSEDQHEDLEKSKLDLKPEIFYTGSNELATDVMAWQMADGRDQQEALAKSIGLLIKHSADQDRENEGEIFYRDQARFTLLAEHIQSQSIDIMSDPNVADSIKYWLELNNNTLDQEDARRYDELVGYLKRVIPKAQKIK